MALVFVILLLSLHQPLNIQIGVLTVHVFSLLKLYSVPMLKLKWCMLPQNQSLEDIFSPEKETYHELIFLIFIPTVGFAIDIPVFLGRAEEECIYFLLQIYKIIFTQICSYKTVAIFLGV